MLREVPKEITKLKKIDEIGVQIPLGYLLESKNLWIVHEGHPSYQGLDQILEMAASEQISWSLEQKLSTLKRIAQVMSYVYQFDSSCVHGHLSLSNILVRL